LPATLGYNRALDGLRALAVGAVIAQHAGFDVGGFYGVTVFFVISGYLITALLLAEHANSGRIGVRAFYRRRWARLAPALFVVVGVSVIWLLAIGVPVSTWIAGPIGALTYSTDILEVTSVVPHISNYFEWSWSLAIEEQFYLLWPVIMIVLLSIGRRVGTRLLLVVSLGVVVLAWVQRAAMVRSGAAPGRVNFAFDTHMDAIAVGAVLAIVVAGRTFGRLTRTAVGLAGLIAILALGSIIRAQTVTRWFDTDANAYGEVTLICLVVVAAVVIAPSGPLSRILAWAPLAHLGKLSYGLYLWNMLVRNVFLKYAGHKPAHTGWAGIMWLATLIVVAELSYRLVETPLRRRWAHRPDRAAAPTGGHASELVTTS
jgi:peptidoglycan/LPS O-acetylase OafA/YrhL